MSDTPAQRGAKKFVRGIIPDKENRQKDDFYPTPPAATRALLRAVTFSGLIWEPACGDGAISKVLEAEGHEVLSTDLVDRGYGTARRDFLFDAQSIVPNIITNPPFKYANEFARRALDLTTGKVAFLCRLAWLEGLERRELFTQTPLAKVLVFSNRIPMNRNGDPLGKSAGGMIAFAWFVWEHAHVGEPTIGWLVSDKIDRAVRTSADRKETVGLLL